MQLLEIEGTSTVSHTGQLDLDNCILRSAKFGPSSLQSELEVDASMFGPLFQEGEKFSSTKVGLKFNIQKTKIMASSPITSWQIDGETMETVRDFIWGGSKITADGDGSHEIKRCLLLGRKVMTNPDSILKSRDITLPTKVCVVKAMVWSVQSKLWFFQQSCMDVRVGPLKKLSTKELMLLNCGIGEDS